MVWCVMVPAVDENLGVILDRVSENPQRAGLELLLLLLFPLLGGHLLLAHSDCFLLFSTGEMSLIGEKQTFRSVSRSAMAPGRESFSVS